MKAWLIIALCVTFWIVFFFYSLYRFGGTS